jgi:hypothetical protein
MPPIPHRVLDAVGHLAPLRQSVFITAMIEWTHSAAILCAGSRYGNQPSLFTFATKTNGWRGTMNPILFLSLVIILSAALPWWPYSASGRSRHHCPWDWLLDTPSCEDNRTPTAETNTRRVRRTWLNKLSFWQHAYETKIFDQGHEALGRGPTPEASRQAAMKLWVARTSNHST